MLVVPPLCYLAWWEAELNNSDHYRHSHIATQPEPGPECRPIPADAVFISDFSLFLFKHGGQEPKGEKVRYAHMATIGLLPNGTLLAGRFLSLLKEAQRYRMSSRRFP
eukprot:7825782-Pyramimonas_sp.AAC.1